MKFLQYKRRAPQWSPWRTFFWWTFIRALVRGTLWIFYRLRFVGQDRIPATGPVIYVANHQSHFDPPAVGAMIYDRPFTALARHTLFDFAPFAWMLRQIGSVPLHRERHSAEAFRAAVTALKAGGTVVIFPEGTRTRDGAIARFRPGMLVLVRRSGAPVVPIAIEGAFDAWSIKRQYPKLTGRILIEAADPIPAEELLAVEPDDAMMRLQKQVDAMRMELRAQLRAESNGRYPAPGPGDSATK